ncbi:SIMPL domain-containing protein [Massilia sp. YIM B02769]|uniref:SIMPL domain-containing protein n=1 Tax=unclassified Massilia TaxID=2609279 RepID=UPI0025B6BDFC|nr:MULTISPECIES: SIMPL domain-containing protein [unclassified Massilia]MDN4058057.1 SIMPL domain-containing protein [Massilia sp. YIM B02769]
MLTRLALAVAIATLPLAAAASPLPGYPFVHVSADASVYRVPDIGAIDFEILVAGADPQAARTTVETRIAEVRALLQAQGVSLEDMETRDVRKEQQKDAPPDAPVYELRSSVHINMRDLSKWAAVVAPLLDMPNLGSFATSFDSSTREEVEAELMANALREARRRAEIIAKGARRKLGAVTAVTPAGVKNVGYAMGLLREDFSSRRGASANVTRSDFLAIEALKLMQPVDVVFRLE